MGTYLSFEGLPTWFLSSSQTLHTTLFRISENTLTYTHFEKPITRPTIPIQEITFFFETNRLSNLEFLPKVKSLEQDHTYAHAHFHPAATTWVDSDGGDPGQSSPSNLTQRSIFTQSSLVHNRMTRFSDSGQSDINASTMSTQETVGLSDAENGDVPLSDDVPEGNWEDFNKATAALFAAVDAVPVSNDVPEGNWEDFNEELDACIAANEGLIVRDVSLTATSPDQAHDLGDSPVHGSTSSFQTSLSPGSEHEEDTESNLGSELTPEEWAELNGEAPPPPPSPPPPPPSAKSKSRKASKARTTGGKKKKGKSQVDERRDTIAKLREDTLRAQKTTSLDRAIQRIQSKVASKTRQIFIDNSLSDIVMHGQTEGEGVMTDNDVSALPKVYHTHWIGEPNYRLLAKHMDLGKFFTSPSFLDGMISRVS